MRIFALICLCLLISTPSYADFTAAEAAVRRDAHADAYEACKAELTKDPGCQNLVGVLFQKGLGVTANLKESVRLFGLAAGKNLPAAQVNLGLAYANALGVEHNDNLAVRWFAVAAKEGDPIGEYDFAQMLLAGRGIEKDTERAIELLKRGADRGYSPAQLKLAAALEMSPGRKTPFAYYWYRIVERTTKDNGIRRVATNGVNRTVLQLYGTEIAAARTASDLWKPTGPAMDYGIFGARQVATATETNRDPKKPYSAGSGFVVSKAGDVLTNNHVIDGCRETKIVHDGKTVAVKVIATDLAADVALLHMPDPAENIASFRETGAKSGEPVLAIGYPLAGALSPEATVTNGIVSATIGPHDDKKRIQITAPVQHGNSGGPLLDNNGRVIGIVSSKINALRMAQMTGSLPENINFAVNAEQARELLDKNNVKYEKTPDGDALTTTSAAERAMKFTVMVQCFK
jgi:hypothetical protein